MRPSIILAEGSLECQGARAPHHVHPTFWCEVLRGSRVFLSTVLQVPKTACDFSRFEYDIPPEGGIQVDFRKCRCDNLKKQNI